LEKSKRYELDVKNESGTDDEHSVRRDISEESTQNQSRENITFSSSGTSRLLEGDTSENLFSASDEQSTILFDSGDDSDNNF